MPKILGRVIQIWKQNALKCKRQEQTKAQLITQKLLLIGPMLHQKLPEIKRSNLHAVWR